MSVGKRQYSLIFLSIKYIILATHIINKGIFSVQMQPLHKGNDKRNFACSTYFPERNASSPAASFCSGEKRYCPSRDLDIRVFYTNFEKSSKNVNIFGKNGRNCPKPISRLLSDIPEASLL